MNREDAFKYKTRICSGYDIDKIRDESRFTLQLNEDEMNDELMDTVMESDEYKELLGTQEENGYKEEYDIDSADMNTYLSGIYLRSEYFQRDSSSQTKVNNNIHEYIYNPIIMETDVNGKNQFFFINLGPEVTFYEFTDVYPENMKEIISSDEAYETPRLGFFVDDFVFSKKETEANKEYIAEDVEKETGTFTTKIGGFYSEIGLMLPVEENVKEIISDKANKQILLDKSLINIDELTGNNTRFYVDHQEMKFKEEYKELPIIELLSDVTKYRENAIFISRMQELQKELSESKTDYDYQLMEANIQKAINNERNFDLEIESGNIVPELVKDNYVKEKEKEYEEMER